jgi:hypothetical protein
MKIDEKMRREDATDCTIKYFILISVTDFFSFLNDFIAEQKARVFNSNIIQIVTHEFIIRHIALEKKRTVVIRGIILILLKIKLQT